MVSLSMDLVTTYNEIVDRVNSKKVHLEKTLKPMQELQELVEKVKGMLPAKHPLRGDLDNLIGIYSNTRMKFSDGVDTIAELLHQLLKDIHRVFCRGLDSVPNSELENLKHELTVHCCASIDAFFRKSLDDVKKVRPCFIDYGGSMALNKIDSEKKDKIDQLEKEIDKLTAVKKTLDETHERLECFLEEGNRIAKDQECKYELMCQIRQMIKEVAEHFDQVMGKVRQLPDTVVEEKGTVWTIRYNKSNEECEYYLQLLQRLNSELEKLLELLQKVEEEAIVLNRKNSLVEEKLLQVVVEIDCIGNTITRIETVITSLNEEINQHNRKIKEQFQAMGVDNIEAVEAIEQLTKGIHNFSQMLVNLYGIIRGHLLSLTIETDKYALIDSIEPALSLLKLTDILASPKCRLQEITALFLLNE